MRSSFYARKTAPFMETTKRKGVCKMILFTILLITLAIIAVSSVLILSVGGAAFIVIFGDLVVCMAIIIWIMRRLAKRRKKK